MERFTAERYFRLGKYLASVRSRLTALAEGDDKALAAAGESGKKTLESVRQACDKINLRISSKCAAALIRTVTRQDVTAKEALGLVSHLERTILWELQDRLFMFVPPDRAAFYNQPELFGKEVNSKFPSLQFDIVEAGNSYAAGRSTAAVFHLMRIMETAVQDFGKKLGVSLVVDKNWQNILDEINKRIKALPSKDPATVELSQASANLYAVKLAWRNEVMHPKDTYTLEEADNLIRQVRIFMQQLEKIL